MGLFSKKPKIRFETITIEREREVFKALESRGFTLCDDPFQFDVQKPAEKLRKDAMSMAKDLHAELVVEIWDPIYQRMPWKGLKYAAWKKATPEEMRARAEKLARMQRPDYSDSMGSYDELQRRTEEKRIKVSEEDLHALDSVLESGDINVKGDMGGKTQDELRSIHEDAIAAVVAFNPYDHQGEMADSGTGSSGPVFDSSLKIDLGVPDSSDPTATIDPLAMMSEDLSETPQGAVGPSPPATTPDPEAPQYIPPPHPPAVAHHSSPPANIPPSHPPVQVPKEKEESGQ